MVSLPEYISQKREAGGDYGDFDGLTLGDMGQLEVDGVDWGGHSL